MKLLALVLALVLAAPAAAQMACTPDNGTQTCEARVPVGNYTIQAKACDAAGNCAVVEQTVVPLASKLEMRQEGDEFVFTWRIRRDMTPTFTATPR